MKIYIHHFFSEILFYKLFHNTTNRVFNIENEVGTVNFKYGEIEFECVFDPVINNNEDGEHLLDYFTAMFQKNQDPKFNDVRIVDMVEDTPFLMKFSELTKDYENWIITFFRTEKIIGRHDEFDDWWIGDVENKLKLLSKHKVVSDNFFLNDDIRYFYPNLSFAFTNTLWQWNEIIDIRWYYEFKNVYSKLNFDYDLIYSVRHHKRHRVEVLNELSQLNNPRILLQRTNSLANWVFNKFDSSLEPLENVVMNSMEGDNDFSNLTLIKHKKGVNWDIFFRFLSKAKLHILDESWAWNENDFHSQYLSEKTYGFILANIPFISTHSYPIEMIQRMLNLKDHPFIEDFRKHKGNSKLFGEFIKSFMLDFEKNYKLCKEWTDMCHDKTMEKLNNENSLIDLMLDGFKKEKEKIKKSNKII